MRHGGMVETVRDGDGKMIESIEGKELEARIDRLFDRLETLRDTVGKLTDAVDRLGYALYDVEQGAMKKIDSLRSELMYR